MARVTVAGGVTADDIIQISFGYGLFTGALGLHFGLEKVGATVIPASSGNTEKQLMIDAGLRRYRHCGHSVICPVPQRGD